MFNFNLDALSAITSLIPKVEQLSTLIVKLGTDTKQLGDTIVTIGKLLKEENA